LITNALTNQVHGAFAVESISKLSDGLERIAKGGVRAVIVDIKMSNGRSVATVALNWPGTPSRIDPGNACRTPTRKPY
jgi:hypothetical protein